MDAGAHQVIGSVNEPVEISYGTCRCLRVRQVGPIFVLEQLRLKDGYERWLAVAKSDGSEARQEILAALNGANEQLEKHFVSIRKS